MESLHLRLGPRLVLLLLVQLPLLHLLLPLLLLAAIGVLATFQPTLPGTRQQFEERAVQRSIPLKLVMHHVPEAMDALRQGDGERHDALIAAAARELKDCACVVLAQFSMARARHLVESAQPAPVLTSPEAAVVKLRQLLGA